MSQKIPRLQYLGARTLHVVIDMQRLFAEGTPWASASVMPLVPKIRRLVAHRPQRTIFTRFMTVAQPEDGKGSWARYYRQWSAVTTAKMDPALLDLVPGLAELAAPESIVDKLTHSAFNDGAFAAIVERMEADALLLSGVETDVCVLATALDAVDRGLHVAIASDAVASSVPEAHDACLKWIYPRYDQQIEVMTTDEAIAIWR